MKKLITGILIGSALTMSASAFADSIKQYILTEVSYPLVVNGKEYKDAAAPILNYEGSTYVPLAKLGDITGVNYKWNDEAKRVEIVTESADVTTLIPTKDGLRDLEGTLAEEEAIRKFMEKSGRTVQVLPDGSPIPSDSQQKPVGLVEENGEIVLYAYDVEGNYRGRYTDKDNPSYSRALANNLDLPPKLSDGWISYNVLGEIYTGTEYEDSDIVFKKFVTPIQNEVLFRFPIPQEFMYQENGDITVNGVRIKHYENGTYFNIADLQKIGAIK